MGPLKCFITPLFLKGCSRKAFDSILRQPVQDESCLTFYTSPLLPLWPHSHSHPLAVQRSPCPRLTSGGYTSPPTDKQLLWLTALADTLMETVHLLLVSCWQPQRPHLSQQKKPAACFMPCITCGGWPLLSGNRFRPLSLASAPDAVYENGGGIKWFRDANIWPAQWSMWAFTAAPPSQLIYGADHHLFCRRAFSDGHQSSLSG